MRRIHETEAEWTWSAWSGDNTGSSAASAPLIGPRDNVIQTELPQIEGLLDADTTQRFALALCGQPIMLLRIWPPLRSAVPAYVC